MTEFLGEEPSAEDYWRSIILFGKNVASYKFALAKSLLEVAPTGKTILTLEELAEPFSRHISEHLKIVDKQTTSKSSRFLDACRQFNQGEINLDQLINSTVRLGFDNVIDAFHNVNDSEIPLQFFVNERRTATKRILLTDEFLQLASHPNFTNFLEEVEARWRLVERAWDLKISRNLITVNYDLEEQSFFVQASNRRIDITSCRPALNGYQKGKCFYCFGNISIEPGSTELTDVDHFFPWMLERYNIAYPINGVWNLVLACQVCNRGGKGKFHHLPHQRFLERLSKRNEFFIDSHHPLRETLIQQTGSSKIQRTKFLLKNYLDAKMGALINTSWEPEIEHKAPF